MKFKFFVLVTVFNLSSLLLTLCSSTVYTATSANGGSLTFAPIIFNGQEQGSVIPTATPTNPTLPPPDWNPGENAWAMAGANPERTSWTPEQVNGNLKPLWYKQFEPYIPPNVQIIAVYGTLYISTASGLYALDAVTGGERWVYPTEMPLGHSPTVYDGIAYVGGFDHKLHAIDAFTGEGLWTFEAGAGFDTNPLVLDGKIYAGNRDGYFYAIHAEGEATGELAWKFQTGGPVLFSAAYKDGIVFFASDDSYAYALNAETGELTWKSDKLPGAGFHSWWPVVYGDWVIFAGSLNYRGQIGPGLSKQFTYQELQDVYPNHKSDPKSTLVGPMGTEPGKWANGTSTIDTSQPNITENGATVPITEYLEAKPWRRTYFVLNRATGDEYTTDFDNDGQPEYAPFLWFGTLSGNRYPPVVGSDGALYQINNVYSDEWIAGGVIAGWQIGSPFISIASTIWHPIDETVAYSSGGDRIYWNMSGGHQAGMEDITTPDNAGHEIYFSYNLEDLIPGYDSLYYPIGGGWRTFGGLNGIYSTAGDMNPLIPYQGQIFTHHSNVVIAFGAASGPAIALPTLNSVNINDSMVPTPSNEQIKSNLVEEVDKILQAGHLQPGWHNSGIFTPAIDWQDCSDYQADYWHNPADTLYTLMRALPHLPEDHQESLETYLQDEFTDYPPYLYTHTGWKDGAPREVFDRPPEVEADRVNFPPNLGVYGYDGWFFNPYGFYAMWKYALLFPGDAKKIFDASEHLLETPPDDNYLSENPHVLNAYIAGYLGYIELQKLAGYPATTGIQDKYNRLLELRVTTFTKDGPPQAPGNNANYCRGLNVSRNFLYLVPELGQHLHDNALEKVQQALDEYYQVAPYWFVSRFGAVYGEGATAHLYDYHSVFQAKALILQESHQELAQYLDLPAVAVGDLYYIDNLIATLNAENQ